MGRASDTIYITGWAMRSRRELCTERAEAEKPPGRTRISHGGTGQGV